LIEKRLHGRQDHRAIDIVLHLLIGLIADAYRPHPAITGQTVDDEFAELGSAADTVHRLQRCATRSRDHIGDVAQVAFHGARGAEAIERVNGEITIAQPTETIVPVATAVGCFRNGGGKRGHYRTGVFEAA